MGDPGRGTLFDLTGKVALVTGAGSPAGIGFAGARLLGRLGAQLVVAATTDRIHERVSELEAVGVRATGFVGDLTGPEQAGDVVERTRAAYGRLDVLVNNAGASFDGFDAPLARRTLDVNFTGMMRLTDRLLPLLRRDARVVMVSSGMGDVSSLGEALRKEVMSASLDRAALTAFVDRFVNDVGAGKHGARGWPSNAYRVSKIAMNAYVRILARDLEGDPRAILVNAACPGWVRTAMGGSSAPRSPEEGAKTPAWLALLPASDKRSGGLYRDEKRVDW